MSLEGRLGRNEREGKRKGRQEEKRKKECPLLQWRGEITASV